MSKVKETQLKTTEVTTETLELQIKHTQYLQLLDYKFVLYKFIQPIERNIQSIQILLELNDNNRYNELYLSLYANLLQLTTPVKIYPNVLTQIIQYPYIPSQLTPDYQYYLVANIVNFKSMNDIMNNENNITDINLKLIIKYNIIENIDTIEKIILNHSNDVKKLIIRDKKICCIDRNYNI